MPKSKRIKNDKRSRSNKRLRQQSAFEFITTYGWAILILAVVLAMLYYFVGIPSTAAPSQCKFLYGTNCQGVIATATGGTTKLTMVITNSQTYPILYPMIKLATDSYGNVSAACLPNNSLIQPGSEIICNMTIPTYVSPGTTLTGTMYLNITTCPSGNINNCQPKQLQTYKGSIITRVTTQTSNIHLTSTSSTSTSTSSTSTSTSSTSSTSTSSTSTSSTSTSSTSTTTTTTSTTTITALCSSGSHTYSSSGVYTFTTPTLCGPSTTYTITLIGAGGGGAISQLMYCTIQQTAPPYCGWSAGAGGGGGGYEVMDASGLAAGTSIAVTVGSGGAAYCSGGCQAPLGGDASYSGGASSVSATNLAGSAGGGGGAVEATNVYAAICSGNPPHASVAGSGGTNTYSGSAVNSVVTNDAGSAGVSGPSASCSTGGGAGGASGGSMGAGGAGATGTAAAQAGGPYGGGGGGGSGGASTYGAAGGASGEVIISWN